MYVSCVCVHLSVCARLGVQHVNWIKLVKKGLHITVRLHICLCLCLWVCMTTWVPLSVFVCVCVCVCVHGCVNVCDKLRDKKVETDVRLGRQFCCILALFPARAVAADAGQTSNSCAQPQSSTVTWAGYPTTFTPLSLSLSLFFLCSFIFCHSLFSYNCIRFFVHPVPRQR